MRNNYAVGTDIVEVDRIRELSVRHGNRFFQHVFTEQEVQWCESRANPYIHLAGRFAAKEAAKKALLALGEPESIPVKLIEIHRAENGPPMVKLRGTLSQTYRFQLSISHTTSLATAVVIAETQ
ncbi:MAG: holo-ACP synthase [Candidatus Neomarinimicrobiota bacterium]